MIPLHHTPRCDTLHSQAAFNLALIIIFKMKSQRTSLQTHSLFRQSTTSSSATSKADRKENYGYATTSAKSKPTTSIAAAAPLKQPLTDKRASQHKQPTAKTAVEIKPLAAHKKTSQPFGFSRQKQPTPTQSTMHGPSTPLAGTNASHSVVASSLNSLVPTQQSHYLSNAYE